MARRIREEDLQAIEEVVRPYPEGRTARQIGDALASAPARRTLQYRLKSLVDRGRLIMDGKGRWARYRAPRQVSVGGPTGRYQHLYRRCAGGSHTAAVRSRRRDP